MSLYQKCCCLLLGIAFLAGRADAARLRVVATTSFIADVAQNIAGSDAEITELIPRSADPHAFDPTPREIARLQSADLILANGLGLESFLEKILSSIGATSTNRLVIVSQGRAPRAQEHPADHDHPHEHEHDHEHAHGETDPHVWLDPTWVELWADNIAHALALRDPEHAELFRQRADDYKRQLRELDEWTRAQFDAIPRAHRALATDHDELGYFAERYGITTLGALIPNFTTVAETSARSLATLQRDLHAGGARVLVLGASANPAMAEAFARDAGCRIVRLRIHALGPPNTETATYLSLMRFNVNTLTEALQEHAP
ncbi:MAG: metal ABC transporter substrate-binding protein [Kiritimatiellae bacterium]|nr:metal ABC transporter substrate-binding protein [Kiritimatiellia bacterium]